MWDFLVIGKEKPTKNYYSKISLLLT